MKVSAPRNTGEGPEQLAEHQRPREDQGPARTSDIPHIARQFHPPLTSYPNGESPVDTQGLCPMDSERVARLRDILGSWECENPCSTCENLGLLASRASRS